MASSAEDLLRAVQQQCAAVQRVAVGSERVVDRLRHGLSVVADRCGRIKRDVDDWERAVKNVDAAAVELEDAAAAYTTPRYVDAVVRGDSRDPAVMVQALSHLTAAHDYIKKKPENAVGERLGRKVSTNLEKAIAATEAFILSSVIQAARATVLPPAHVVTSGDTGARSAATRSHYGKAAPAAAASRGGSATSAPRDARMLKSDWRRRLGLLYTLVEQHAMLFGRLEAPREVVTSLGDRIARYLEARLTLDYQRRHEGFDSDDAGAVRTGGRGGTVAAMKFLFTRSAAVASFEEEQQARGATMSTYQRGDHPFCGHSIDVRELVAEGCDVVKVVVLRAFPTSEDDQRYHKQMESADGREIRTDAFLLPSELVLGVVVVVFERAHRAVRHLARSPSIGIHDAIFAALDIVGELWHWRRVARQTPGDSAGLAQEVDSNVDTIMSAAHELLGDLQMAKGNLSAEELVRSVASDDYVSEHGLKLSPSVLQLIGVHSREIGDAAVAGYSSEEDEEPAYDDDEVDDDYNNNTRDEYSDAGDDGGPRKAQRGGNRGGGKKKKPVIPRIVRMRWLPSLEGAVHPSTTSLLRFLKHLLGGFAAVSCIVLAGGTCAEADDLLAKQRKLRTSAGGGPDAGAAAAGKSWAEPVEAYVDCCVSGHLADLDAIADAGAVSLNDSDAPVDDPLAPFNRPLFIANNTYFVMRAIDEDAPFASTAHNRAVCEPLVVAYKHRLGMALDNYAHLWASVLPPLDRDRHLLDAASTDAETPLEKSQRAAVKSWYEDACTGLSNMLHASRSHVVAQTALREALSDAAADAVSSAFDEFDAQVVKGRAWSTRPHRHLDAPIEELVAQVRSVFGGAGAGGGGGGTASKAGAGTRGVEL